MRGVGLAIAVSAVIGVAVIIVVRGTRSHSGAPPAEPAAAPKVITIAAAMPEVVTITAEMRAMKPAAMELAAMEAANAAGSERAAMEAAATEPAAMEAATAVETPATAVETAATVETSAAATAVETSAPATAVGTSASASTSAMSVGGIWLAERCNAQQSKGGGCQSPSCAGASFLFAELLHRRHLLHGPPTGICDSRARL